MAARIPFVREMNFAYEEAEQVSPLIRRLVANNPGPFTFLGTGVYIIGRGDVAVVDLGPWCLAGLASGRWYIFCIFDRGCPAAQRKPRR